MPPPPPPSLSISLSLSLYIYIYIFNVRSSSDCPPFPRMFFARCHSEYSLQSVLQNPFELVTSVSVTAALILAATNCIVTIANVFLMLAMVTTFL